VIRFARLFHALDSTTKTSEKIEAIVDYFSSAAPSDAAWATWFLMGNKLRRLVPMKLLRQWAAEEAGIPSWLFEESYHAVGDLAETLSLVVAPGTPHDDLSLCQWIESRLLPLRGMDEQDQRAAVLKIWRQTAQRERLVIMKLVTGGFRVGVSKRLLSRSIAQVAGIPVEVISHRLMGDWEPTAEFFERLRDPDVQDTLASQPYPFCLAHPIDAEVGVQALGDPSDYLAEWKWDGIRCQLLRRDDQTFLWSRGEELMENRWPEVEHAAQSLPDGTVLDGEILAARGSDDVLPFAQLQRRIGRKRVGKKLLNEVPVIFFAFDLLEARGSDIRDKPYWQRREFLEALFRDVDESHLRMTDRFEGLSWSDLAALRESSRQHQAEGLMLKRKDAAYDVGRVRGTWWKWKVDPYTIDAVMIYAQKGHGRRANLFTDYTFGLWDDGALVPFAKAYSGLNDSEIRQVDRFVRQNTSESFGPVRRVTPQLVMELAFEGLQASTRHKSGVATRFPRIVRWRHDKRPEDANTLEELKQLLPADG
jgi:DNA ligase-1